MNRPTLMLGDCLERMGEIADGSIDLVLTDLPYGTTACSWDSVIPFGPLWEHYRRLLSPRGAVVLMASQPFTSMLVASNLGWFKYCLVWEKEVGTNFLNAGYQPLKVHEDIAIFSAAPASRSPRDAMIYRPQMESRRPMRGSGKKTTRGETFHARPADYPARLADTSHPRSVLRFDREMGLHPTQKPVPLMKYLINTYTDEGATVLDNCMGSGTTGVACQLTGRDFVGIERDPDYFAVAERRMAEAATPLFDLV